MKVEDLGLLAQLIESMDLSVKELEKVLARKDAEKIKIAKNEILKFQREIFKILRGIKEENKGAARKWQ